MSSANIYWMIYAYTVIHCHSEQLHGPLVSFPDPNNPSVDCFQYLARMLEAIRTGVV